MKTQTSETTGTALGARIRDARGRFGWSLAETSRRTGLSRAYINALELGRGKRPGAEAIRRLEDVLGPLRSPSVVDEALPPGLQALALERRLPATEVKVLSGIRVRGEQPLSAERWRFIYDALLASESMDRESRKDA